MSRRSGNASSKAGPSKEQPPEPFSPPPPTPPPPPQPVSFAEGADFLRFDNFSDDSDVALSDHVPVLSTNAKGKQKAAENARKRKSDAMDDPFDNSRKVRSKTHTSRSQPWMEHVRWDGCLNAAEMLHREVEAFYQYLSPTEEEHAVREMIIQTIERAILGTFPDARLKPFGSFETRLYLPMGDIDLVLCSREVALHDKKRVLQLLASVMKRAEITNHVTIIAKARVPIIKFVTRVGKLSVDISINQETGVVAGSVVNSYLEAFPAARRLIMIMKAFLKQREINEVFSGGLGSYSTVLLVINFLQMHPKVRRGEIDAAENLGVLTNEFLELYGKYFNYVEVGISVLDGGSYFNKRRRGWGGKNGIQLSIEDPCDTANDVSAGSFAMHRVKNAFSGANDALTLALLKKAQNLIDLGRQYYEQDRPDSRYRRYVEPDFGSMLGNVVGVTEEVIHHRRLIQSVWDSGTLHRLVGETAAPKQSGSLPQIKSKTKPPSSRSRSKKAEKSPPVKTVVHNPVPSSQLPNSRGAKSTFSMDQELDMVLSEGEIIYVGSDTEGETESRYSMNPPKQKRGLKSRYVLRQDSSGDDDSQQEEIIRPRPAAVAKRSKGTVKIDRKREYWTSKAGLAVGTPLHPFASNCTRLDGAIGLSAINSIRLHHPLFPLSFAAFGLTNHFRSSKAGGLFQMSTLRERIAALQQRSASPSANAQAASAKQLRVASEGKSLKDKIANFEKRGGTPIPRSSFGLAPPSQDKASSREMYGNRFVGTPTPVDLMRSNSTRSISPNPDVKRERRVSSYGDGGWSSQIRHQRSYSTADNLVPMHTGTTSSDEVSSMTSSFPATPRDISGSFLRMNESFKEDPEDYDENESSILESQSPSRDLSPATPEIFRNAYDRFAKIDLNATSPIPNRKKSLASSSPPPETNPEPSLPDIIINETVGESARPATNASPETARSVEPPMAESPSLEAGAVAERESVRKGRTDSEDGAFGYAIVHGRSKVPRRSPSPSPSPSERKVVSPPQSPEPITAQDRSPSNSATPPTSPQSLKVKKSQPSIRKLSPLKPPERPISFGLSTPEIMDRFPAVPAAQPSPTPAEPPVANVSSPKVSTPEVIVSTTAAPAPATQPNSNVIAPSQPAKKPNPKSAIPGWWDYNSDDEEVGGWATVVVATSSRY